MSQRAFACPKCKTRLAVPEGAARFRCPKCKTVLSAPSEPAPAPAAPTPAMSPEAAQELVGRDIAGYHIERLIGQGGMGTVYEAIQAGLKRRVALKLLPAHFARDTAFLANFKREAQAVAKLNHPNIIQIFDIIEEDGFHFFSMEMVDGESLGERLARDGKLPVSESLGIVAQVAAALDYAYEHMLIHRDLKPNNILLSKGGDVKVVDLGLSRSLEESAVGIVGGTHGGPVYMAPEFGQNPALADCRADIYALGCVLFHMITGRPPFPGPSAAELVSQHLSDPFPSARALDPKIPSTVDTLLSRMCAKDANRRFQTHGELLEQIGVLLSSTTVRMPKVVQANPVARRQRRKRRKMWPFGMLLLVAAVTLGAFLGPPVFRSGEPEAENVSAGQADAASTAATPAPDESGSDVVVVTDGDTEPIDALDAQSPPPGADLEPDPKQPEKVDWSAQFLAAKEAAAAFARQDQFAQAITATEALLAVSPDDADLKASVEQAVQAIRRQAAEQCAKARTDAERHADAGEFDKARRLLLHVVEAYGTPAEVHAAKVALEALGRQEERHTIVSGAIDRARATAEAASRRAAALRLVAGALEAAGRLAASWQLTEALKPLEDVQTDDTVATALLTPRRDALSALVDLRNRIIHAIQTARPPITKRAAAMVGLNGDLVAADETGITAKTPRGEEETAWSDVRAETVHALAGKAAGPDAVAHRRGKDLFLALLANEKPLAGEALAALAEAETEAKAARAFSDALQLLAKGPNKQASDALAAYARTYGKTKHFADHEQTYGLVASLRPGTAAVAVAPKPKETPEKPATPDKPQPPKPAPAARISPEELALYNKAVAAYQARRFADVKTHLDALKTRFANSALLADTKRTPPVPIMLRAVAARGRTITLSSKADGAARSLEAALAAVEKPNATIEVQPGTYRGSGEASGRDYSGLILRRSGDGDAILDGGRRADRILNLLVDCNDVWIEGIQFANARAGLYVGPRSSAILVDCIVLEGLQQGVDKAPGAKLAVHGCALSARELNQVQARASAFVIAPEGFIESSSLTGCVVTGSDISLDGVALTDCLLVGSVSLGSRTKLTHVTAVGAVTIPETAQGALITDSIVESLHVETPEIAADEVHALAVTLDRVALIRPSARRWAKGLVKEEKVVSPARVQFMNRRAGDYRLAEGSAYATGGSDKTPLGCRFPAAMLELLKLARRYPAILKPPSRRRSGWSTESGGEYADGR